MTTLAATDLDPAFKRAWGRLLIACAISLILHFALLLGVPLNPSGGTPHVPTIISARLEPAVGQIPAAAATEPQAAIGASPDKSAAADALAESGARKAVPESKPVAVAAPPAVSGAGLDLPLLRDPTYYPARQLDVYPKAQEINEPRCTPAAERDRVIGKLLILALIDEYGVVNAVSVVEAEPEGYMEEVTLAAFRSARFFPALRQGRDVKSRALIRVVFDCTDTTLR